MAEDKLVVAAAFLYPDEARVAQSLLESEGIQTFLQNEHLMTVQPLWGLATGGYQLMVPASFLERAQELLAAQQVSDEALAAEAGAAEAPDDAEERD